MISDLVSRPDLSIRSVSKTAIFARSLVSANVQSTTAAAGVAPSPSSKRHCSEGDAAVWVNMFARIQGVC